MDFFCIVGNHCELNINDCIHNPCGNNGTCIDGIKDYSCKCYTGYTGNSKLLLSMINLVIVFENFVIRKKL